MIQASANLVEITFSPKEKFPKIDCFDVFYANSETE